MQARPIEQADLEVSVEIDASPDDVWALVSDVTRTPEWSPVVRRCEWLDADAASVGARFKGHNRFNGFRWSRECVVSEVRLREAFAFSTFGKRGEEQTRWRYLLEPSGDGTRVTLGYEIVTTPRWVRWLRRLPGGRSTNERQARWNLEESLRRLRERLETAGADSS